MPLSLQEQHMTASAVNAFARLLALDRARTDYLQRTERPIPEEDVDTLSDMTDEMERLLDEARYRAELLEEDAYSHRVALDESYQRMLSSDELTEDQKDWLQSAKVRLSIEYMTAPLGGIVAGAYDEIRMLRTEMSAVRRGDAEAGDLSSKFLCNLAAGCIIGGLLAPPPTNIIGVVIGILTIVHVETVVGEEC